MSIQTHIAQLLAAGLETPRLHLEPLCTQHADAFFPLLQEEPLYRWISMNKPASLEGLRENWRHIECRMSPDQAFAWPTWAVRRKSDGQYLGELDAEINDCLEAVNFGYYFFSPFWGQAYATEAVMAATRQLRQRGVRRFVATVTVGNQASVRVLQKAGFAFTRTLPGNDRIRGAMVDDEEYVLD
ncbi:MAG: GNAT family N-acetyltransferase [Rhodoferax sp.]|jgi:ribosomal-protein-alanine N-acetyltransferase|uniref:GNAT family N-acetyltransferase n=1 Tax=Rhodoferax sp. TaxID=50421 RepID=UPI001B60A584|nr:GNAT family N-acetyltransferase [Rhodoferax sp.]MBP9147549.1 GNAT family N-acetyltransferase [Rhodoferax sp.]MBP9735317.1 GNAT family N-acetyltransferase [Rhodoferax sp.]